MDFLKEKAKKAALEKGRELIHKLDQNSSSNATSEMDSSQKSPDEETDPAKAEQLRVEQRLSSLLDDPDSVPSNSANSQADSINPPQAAAANPTQEASANPTQEAPANPPAKTSSNPPEKAAAKANDVNKPSKLQSTVDKSIDTYKNGQNLINRGKEFLDLANSIKTKGIIAIACVVLSIVMGIATPIANHFITKHFEETPKEETSVVQQTKNKLLNLKEVVLPSDTEAPKADVPGGNENPPEQAVVPTQSPNGAAAPVRAADSQVPAAPAAAPVPAADSPVHAVPAPAVPEGQQPSDLSALFGQNISELSTTQLRGLVSSMTVVSNALNALISTPNAVDCSGAACEASYRQKMDELLKTHAAAIKEVPNTDREALLVAFGELKNTIQQSSNKLNAQFPQKAPVGVYQSISNYLKP